MTKLEQRDFWLAAIDENGNIIKRLRVPLYKDDPLASEFKGKQVGRDLVRDGLAHNGFWVKATAHGKCRQPTESIK